MARDSLQLFITGVYRTGSTYLSLLLNNHPDLSVGLHTTNWFRQDHETVDQAIDYAQSRWGIEPQAPDFTPERENTHAWDVTMRRLFGISRWGEKQQLETSNIPTFFDWFPEGKSISIVRDPRSVLASWRRYTYHDPPVHLQAAFNCLGALQKTHRFERELPQDRFRYVRYEDLAQETHPVVRDLIRWLELPWPGEEIMLGQDGWAQVPGSRWGDRSSYDDPGDLDVQAAVNRWRGNLEEHELAFVERVCGEEMEWFEYEREVERNLEYDELEHIIESENQSPDQVERTLEMFEKWVATGDGVEMFPDEDVTNQETWTENQ